MSALNAKISDPTNALSLFHGPQVPGLWDLNTGQLLDNQSQSYGEKVAIISKWQGVSWTYQSLRKESRRLGQKLLEGGVRPGDRVVILAGNCIEYIQLFFASTAIGAILVMINATFTAEEIIEAVDFVEPRVVFLARQLGFRDNRALLKTLSLRSGSSREGDVTGSRVAFDLVYIADKCADLDLDLDLEDGSVGGRTRAFPDFLCSHHGAESPLDIDNFWGESKTTDVCCLQFTSGTTGARKASMLSHSNLINNARLVGDRLAFSEQDVLCCPPPLFHCFGLVCGLLAVVTHGSALILPSEVFNPASVLQSLLEERCTAIHAVPTMFEAVLNHRKRSKVHSQFFLRTGIIAGASLTEALLRDLSDNLGLKHLLYAFGMTELSAVSFMTTLQHSLLLDRSTVGTLMPHTTAKVIDVSGQIVPRGNQGELYVSGYLVHQGYYKEPQKSTEAVQRDDEGRDWLKTGDVVSISKDGFCSVMGRTKDLIKKGELLLAAESLFYFADTQRTGGENIIPKDIEDILITHPDVWKAAVIGIKDDKWGEVVGVFLQQSSAQESRLKEKNLKVWMRKHKIAPHKMPDHYFHIGRDEGVPDELPVNGSGKVLKAVLRSVAQEVVSRRLGAL